MYVCEEWAHTKRGKGKGFLSRIRGESRGENITIAETTLSQISGENLRDFVEKLRPDLRSVVCCGCRVPSLSVYLFREGLIDVCMQEEDNGNYTNRLVVLHIHKTYPCKEVFLIQTFQQSMCASTDYSR